ncbi:MAG: class I SAM-dependent methyltransferase [Trichlorobacter sp.]|uniref:class I SAM-dependent methyltransferase n=1 Tax=Trichlorobacter sp. TaxID=2911007 RepID=UPI002566C37D|nr:class I SAM-dependent methyltransferase [Trichlorobacter sp.]MDK9717933.1 class I SAM-dependent methyltransferase [Trichlorobacter sp.]
MSSAKDSHPVLRGPVPLTHLLLRRFIQSGNRVADATCGNGKDTLLLAELAGKTGHVWAFDIQQEALDRTAQRLTEQNLQQRVTLLQTGHERLLGLVDAPLHAIIFNLGWLPGASREVATCTATTLTALEASLQLLAPAGLVLITCYPGHAGGDQEAAAVQDWAAGLSSRSYFVWRMGQLNVTSDAPFCLLIQDGRIADAK